MIAATLLLLTLLGGMIGTTFGLYRANESAKRERAANIVAQEKRAEAELQRTRAEAREQQAIDAVKQFGDAVANNPELKNNPALEGLRKALLNEPLSFFQSHRERLQADTDTRPESLARLAYAAWGLAQLTGEIGDKQDALTSYEQSIAILTPLVEANPTVTQYQSGLAGSHNNIGNLLSATGKPGEALAAYEKEREIRERLVAANPTVTDFQSDLAASHLNIGILLSETGEPGEALAAFEKAREIRERLVAANPTVTDFQSDLGATLNNLANIKMDAGQFAKGRDHLRDAIAWQKKALAGNPTNPAYRQLLKNHFNNLAGAADGLFDRDLRAKAERGLAELAASDPQFAALDRRMTALIGGQQAKDAAELLALGQRAYDLRRFALATRWFGEALERDTALADDRRNQPAYNAACCAALAGCNQSPDDPAPDESAREKLRGQALAWLQDELGRWTQHLESASAEQRQVVAATLKHWQEDSDLAGIRDEAELAKFPESERTAFETLWNQVAELIALAEKEGGTSH